jgi:ATP-binding protein involved in chromosome partitioning
MSYYKHKLTEEVLHLFGRGGGERLATETKVPFLGKIPIDPEISVSGDLGRSIFTQKKEEDGPLIKIFTQLAKKVVEQIDILNHSSQNLSGDYEIIWKDEYTFTVKWRDGKSGSYRLNELQKNCPCANCVDENTGKKILDLSTVKDDVRANSITPVGRYGIRVAFTSGCSTGIYSYDMLREMSYVEKN